MMNEEVTFESLVGLRRVSGRGQFVAKAKSKFDEDSRVETLVIDGRHYSFVESENDGYRSCLAYVTKESQQAIDMGIVDFDPVVVAVHVYRDHAGHELLYGVRESDGLLLFMYGTDKTDYFYPMFIAEWHPDGAPLPWFLATVP